MTVHEKSGLGGDLRVVGVRNDWRFYVISRLQAVVDSLVLFVWEKWRNRSNILARKVSGGRLPYQDRPSLFKNQTTCLTK